jgi:hypothetical protein
VRNLHVRIPATGAENCEGRSQSRRLDSSVCVVRSRGFEACGGPEFQALETIIQGAFCQDRELKLAKNSQLRLTRLVRVYLSH